MGLLEEMLLRNNLIQHNPDGSTSIVGECAVRAGLTITDASGRVTHRVENSVWPGEVVLRNLATDVIEERIRAVA